MTEVVKSAVAGQYHAALAMLEHCLRTCPDRLWDGVIGKYPFWQVAYHTLCFADLYLSPSDTDFQPHESHPAGWREFDDEYPSRRFDRAELLDYTTRCREKTRQVLAAETCESLSGPSGFARRTFSRIELHVYNIRHIQHHTGQLAAFLRRMEPALQELGPLPWIATAS